MGKHIVRIDQPKDDPKRGTHGWQIRAGRKKSYHSKLFSDSIFGSKDKALVEAQKYLEAYLKEYPDLANVPNSPFRENGLTTRNTSGVNGVFRTHDYARWDAKKERKQYYWGAFYTIDRYGNKKHRHEKFYVHEWGETEAKRRAIEFRKLWEEAAKEGVDAVKKLFETYRDGFLDL